MDPRAARDPLNGRAPSATGEEARREGGRLERDNSQLEDEEHEASLAVALADRTNVVKLVVDKWSTKASALAKPRQAKPFSSKERASRVAQPAHRRPLAASPLAAPVLFQRSATRAREAAALVDETLSLFVKATDKEEEAWEFFSRQTTLRSKTRFEEFERNVHVRCLDRGSKEEQEKQLKE